MNGAILIVDDSLTVRMGLADAFVAAGFAVVPCATAAAARDALARGPIALAVLDVLLPDGDGVSLLEEIRSTRSAIDVPVMMLSSEAEVRDRVRGLGTGANDYVGKPYDTTHVVERARELLRDRTTQTADEHRLVLVIDDSVTARAELCRALGSAGYETRAARDGEEGLRSAAALRPHAIVVDGVMPGLDGATVIRRVRLDAALRTTPCLLLTGADDDSAELRALDSGADAFARKGDLGVVVARLSAILRTTAHDRSDTASVLGPKRLLAVDDSPTYLEELASVLRDDGYDVVLARSGEEALEMLAVQLVDCVLLDLMMPGIGGQETCRRIKSAPIVRDIPLIMLTALENRDAMIAGLAVGADDYIAKSSETDVLRARVRAQLRRKQFEDEHRRVREELLRREAEAAESRAARELAETKALLVEQLAKKNEELEAFSYSVSHDLRAPLRSIIGFGEALAMDHSEQLDESGRAYLARMRAAAARMNELIDDLLELSRLGRIELVRERVDVSALGLSVWSQLAQREPDRRACFDVRPAMTAEADPRLLRVLLENLLGNARKFSARVAEPRVQLDAELRDGVSVYFVRDNGAGFDMRYAQRLFEPFQRMHAEHEFAGTGIGLATVRRIVDRHGGRVWVDAAVGSGATVYFTVHALEHAP